MSYSALSVLAVKIGLQSFLALYPYKNFTSSTYSLLTANLCLSIATQVYFQHKAIVVSKHKLELVPLATLAVLSVQAFVSSTDVLGPLVLTLNVLMVVVYENIRGFRLEQKQSELLASL